MCVCGVYGVCVCVEGGGGGGRGVKTWYFGVFNYWWNAKHCWQVGECAHKIRSMYNITVCTVGVTCIYQYRENRPFTSLGGLAMLANK